MSRRSARQQSRAHGHVDRHELQILSGFFATVSSAARVFSYTLEPVRKPARLPAFHVGDLHSHSRGPEGREPIPRNVFGPPPSRVRWNFGRLDLFLHSGPAESSGSRIARTPARGRTIQTRREAANVKRIKLGARNGQDGSDEPEAIASTEVLRPLGRVDWPPSEPP